MAHFCHSGAPFSTAPLPTPNLNPSSCDDCRRIDVEMSSPIRLWQLSLHFESSKYPCTILRSLLSSLLRNAKTLNYVPGKSRQQPVCTSCKQTVGHPYCRTVVPSLQKKCDLRPERNSQATAQVATVESAAPQTIHLGWGKGGSISKDSKKATKNISHSSSRDVPGAM